jgi:glycopeptide antibiotics resistance protein
VSATRARWWGIALCLLLLTGILAATLGSTPIDRCWFTALQSMVAMVRSWPGFGWFDYTWLERLANVALFLPLGGVLTLLAGRWWLALATSAVLSALIELVQRAMLPERTASLGDIVANTVGATAGVAAVSLLARRRSARRDGRPGAAE